MFGTSGSTIEDMKIVLGKVASGAFDTNVSVYGAISGMRGAEAGIAALENRTLAGKIVAVYPWLRDVDLVPLKALAGTFPTVAAKLDGGESGARRPRMS